MKKFALSAIVMAATMACLPSPPRLGEWVILIPVWLMTPFSFM
jgi:hypothetical protein